MKKRGVRLDSFLFDDGWDNPGSLWEFNKGFPDGFTHGLATGRKVWRRYRRLAVAVGRLRARKKQRIAFGRSQATKSYTRVCAFRTEILSRFHQVCREMIERYGVNQFKLDGTGNANSVFPGSVFDSDFDAAIHLIQTLRAGKHGVFINLTTGTWASPFWLLYRRFDMARRRRS